MRQFPKKCITLIMLSSLCVASAVFSQEARFSVDQLTASPDETQYFPVLAMTENQDGNPTPQAAPRKSGNVLNVFSSLILPGTGEWAMGYKTLGKVFLGIDALIWIGFFASDQYTANLQGDLQGFAAVHAGVNSANKDGQYWIDIGIQENLAAFNHQKLLERDLEATYPEGQGYEWQWDSEDSRANYLEQRFNKLDWERTSNVFVVGLILNRLVSAVDVIRLIRKDKKAAEMDAMGANRKSYMHMNYAWNKHQGEVLKFNFTMLLN